MYRKIILSILILVCFSSAKATRTIYVSPEGCDCGSGTYAAPLLHIDKALEVASEIDEDVEIILLEGTYRLEKTIVIDRKIQSGIRHLVIRGIDSDHLPIISSDYHLSNWKKVEDKEHNIWVCDISKLPMDKRHFKVMYDGDIMLRRARSAGFVPTCEKLPRFECWKDLTTLNFPKGALRSWNNLDDVEIVIRPNQRYVVNILPLASVDESKCIAKTAISATYFMGPCEDDEYPNASAWVENVPEALDEPGEWRVNSLEGKVYYIPIGERPSDDITVPLLTDYFTISGDGGDGLNGDIPIKNVEIRNIAFTRADRDAWTSSDKGLQHDWDFWDKDNATIRMRFAENCTISGCKIYNTGADAIRLDCLAMGNTVENNTITRIGGTGILLDGYGPGIKDVNRGNTITNNDISYCGIIYWHSPAIFLWESGSNLVSHNKIGNMPYNGIVVSGVRPRFFNVWTDSTPGQTKDVVPKDLRENMLLIRWEETGHPKTAKEVMHFNHANCNILEYNELFNCVELLKDGNPIYYSAAGDGNILRSNLIYNSPNSAMEVRFDDDQFDVLAEKNIIYGKGFRAKHGNYMVNNIVFGGSVGIGNNTTSETRIERNIFILNNPSLYLGTFGDKGQRQERMDNVLLCFNHDCNIFYSKNAVASNNLSALQNKGMETKSLFCNPKFINQDKYVLELAKDSPALKLGIEQIDYDKIGLIKDPAFPRFRKEGKPAYKQIKVFLYEIK